jgi:CO/xanthine dehydrogenase FAD-binding subunit
MKPPPFDYIKAESPQHACELLAAHGEEARLLAGGQSLIPMMNLRLARPSVLIDIGRLEMGGVAVAGESVRLGATVRHRQLLEDEDLGRHAPIFAETARHIAHPTIRNLGTAGGSVATADPTGELPALLMLLNGEVTALSQTGTRQIPAANFFRGAFTTSLEPHEMVTELRLTLPAGSWGGCFLELAERDGDFATASVGAVVAVTGERVASTAIVLSGAESVPVRADAAEKLLAGEVMTDDLARAAGQAAIEGHASYTDIRASAAYRRHLLSEFTRRALMSAYSRARAAA